MTIVFSRPHEPQTHLSPPAFQIPTVIDRAAANDSGLGASGGGRPVAPAAGAFRRVPRPPAVDGHLDASDHAAGVGGAPATSNALPASARGLPSTREVGGVRLVEAAALTNPGCSVAGCTPMSANRLTVACESRAPGP